ncbi:MAG: Na+/H+ antiporter subunit E [Chloroflexota bacterium]|jgi:multicomponent Na+:H+ antiporter subunit E|nr:Na+/H+ antiporter subunit E [Chloroflexota bacterium]
MRALLLNLVLALSWGAMTGGFAVENLLIGFALGFGVIYIGQHRTGRPAYAAKVWEVVSFIGFYIWELILANLRVAQDVLSPRPRIRPGILALRLDATTDAEITLFANLMTLTPGELSIDVSADRSVIYAHSLYLFDIDEARRRIEDDFEARVLRVMR